MLMKGNKDKGEAESFMLAFTNDVPSILRISSTINKLLKLQKPFCSYSPAL